MKYLSLFTGIGGFELGIQQAYERLLDNQSKNDELQAEQNIGSNNGDELQGTPMCIGYSEIDKYATQVYQSHFPTHKNYGDITKINADELPDFDLIVGGFPCQSFSIAGKRRGFEDTRGTLFFDIARILQTKKPRLLLLENVKGLLSHDNGKTFRTIITTLDELGYDLQWQVHNSKNFGVPQNRERVFIVGHLRGTPRPEVFPFGYSEREIISSQRQINQLNQPIHSNDRIYETNGISPTLNTMQGGRRQPKVMLSEHRTELGKTTRKEIRKKEGRDSTLRGKDHKEYRPNSHNQANCLTTGQANIEKWVIEDMKIRRLTPLECERLQGFPDNWTQVGIEYPIDEYYKDEHKILKREVKISDTQRYKMCGNAVTVNVIQKIMEKLLT